MTPDRATRLRLHYRPVAKVYGATVAFVASVPDWQRPDGSLNKSPRGFVEFTRIGPHISIVPRDDDLPGETFILACELAHLKEDDRELLDRIDELKAAGRFAEATRLYWAMEDVANKIVAPRLFDFWCREKQFPWL